MGYLDTTCNLEVAGEVKGVPVHRVTGIRRYHKLSGIAGGLEVTTFCRGQDPGGLK